VLGNGLELLFSDVLLVESDVEFALNFGAGTLSISKKADELDVAAAVETSAMLCIAEPAVRCTWSWRPKSLPKARLAVHV
jgi:hypothetical protein